MCLVRSRWAVALKGWLDLQQYYISAFKSGVYPRILRDRVFLWARLHPASADAPQDGIGRPLRWESVRSALSSALVTADANSVADRGRSLGCDLFCRWERLCHVEVWRLLGNG